MAPKIIYRYTGKPGKSQNLGTGFTKITDGRFKAPGDGWMWTLLYLNTVPKYASGKSHSGLRTRMVRESPLDETAYQDWACNKGMVASAFLLTQTWFGAAERDRYYNWQGKRAKSLTSASVSTRYTKWLWVSKDLALALNSLTPATMAELVEVMAYEGDEPKEWSC